MALDNLGVAKRSDAGEGQPAPTPTTTTRPSNAIPASRTPTSARTSPAVCPTSVDTTSCSSRVDLEPTTPMVMRTFAEALDFTGTTVYPLTTHALSGLGTAERDYADACPGATLGEGSPSKARRSPTPARPSTSGSPRTGLFDLNCIGTATEARGGVAATVTIRGIQSCTRRTRSPRVR